MLIYRCYFLGTDSQILAMRDFYAENDVEALALARAFVQGNKSQSFELWEGSHYIHCETAEAARTPGSGS
jgi:hypothetical protein